MSINRRWILPEGIEEILPDQAWQLEHLRRQLLDLYRSWGYELIIPPMVEYLDSLTTGLGEDLEQQTFKTLDGINGRTLGIRPDITPQAARIDAHRIGQEGPTRLCYAGSVLLTHPSALGGSRSPMQVGVELFGHHGVESDIEVLSLLIESLNISGIDEVHIDLGHVAVFRSLAAAASLTAELEAQIFDCLQRKSVPDLQDVLAQTSLDMRFQNWFLQLLALSGDISVLDKAKRLYVDAPANIQHAIAQLELIAGKITQRFPKVSLYIDLAELRGYTYHTGSVFAAYVMGEGQAIAQGGRYDHIGEVFGRARPATGFSADMKTLLMLSGQPRGHSVRVLAPDEQDPELAEIVQSLRQQGLQVVVSLPATEETTDFDQKIVKQKGQWKVINND